MENTQRLRSGYPMIRDNMRSAMAMIELIFAIVIISISLLTIPSMMSVADKSSKGIAIDDDVLARISGWTLEKFQARWDLRYDVKNQGPLIIASVADLNCSRTIINCPIGFFCRENNDSNRTCSTNLASNIPASGDGNLSRGIEQLNNGTELINVKTAATGESYNLSATYQVRYVDSTVTTNGNTATATWRLGSSGTMAPDGTLNSPTHLKRVVTRFYNDDLGVDTTLTFFKSNKGTNDD